MSLSKRSSYVPAAVPSSGRAIAESLSMVSITVITACLCASQNSHNRSHLMFIKLRDSRSPNMGSQFMENYATLAMV